MSSSLSILTRQSQRILQVGVGLLLFTSFQGFAMPYLASPRLGLSLHSLSGLTSAMFLGLGAVWPRLQLGGTSSRLAFGLLLYSNLALLMAYAMGAVWGAGNESLPMAAGPAHGTAFQEALIKYVMYSCGPTVIMAFALIFWGLRSKANRG